MQAQFSKQEAIEEITRRLVEFFSPVRIYLFGSEARGDAGPDSDLDFLVEFGPFPKGGYSEHYFGLIDDLTGLFGRPVDLVVARAVRNPYLLKSINQTREPLFAAA